MSEYLWRCDIKNWVILRVTDDQHREFIQGEVINDNKGRFAPGAYVYSTEINKKVGDWTDIESPDEGRHVQTNGDTHYYPNGPGRIVNVNRPPANLIRKSGYSVEKALAVDDD